jgi:hypothetical protein
MKLEDLPVDPDIGGPWWEEITAVKAAAVRQAEALRAEAEEDEYEPLTWGVGGESPPKPSRFYQFA